MNVQLIVYNGLPVAANSAKGVPNAVPATGSDGSLTVAALTADSVQSVGGLGAAVATRTAGGTVPTSTFFERLDTTSGAFTRTLPPAASVAGQIMVFKKVDSSGNLATLAAAGGELIDGAATYTGLSAQYNTVRVFANGTGWDKI